MSTTETEQFLPEAPVAMTTELLVSESFDAVTSGVRVRIHAAGEEGRELAAATVAPAELDGELAKLGDEALHQACVVRDVSVDEQSVAALAYGVARRARINDRTNLLLPAAATALTQFVRAGSLDDTWFTQRVDLSAHYAASQLAQDGSAVLGACRGQEVRESAERWLSTGRQWGFFQAVIDGTLTRAQYVYALSNIYQFVRHTTRLAARAIAHSPTTEMRSHFISHLNGEINHELMIERDLQHLGEDVEFVRDHMAPNGPTQEFMAVQESLIGYYEDPVLLMASPVAAEGVTGHLDEPFIESLKRCVASWGVKNPEKCCRFLTSHMHTDGGDDGHWEMTVQYAGKCLVDESKHLFFVRSMRNAMRGTQRLYESFVVDIPNWESGQAKTTNGQVETTVHA